MKMKISNLKSFESVGKLPAVKIPVIDWTDDSCHYFDSYLGHRVHQDEGGNLWARCEATKTISGPHGQMREAKSAILRATRAMRSGHVEL